MSPRMIGSQQCCRSTSGLPARTRVPQSVRLAAPFEAAATPSGPKDGLTDEPSQGGRGATSIHGSDHPGLGTPVSHGCVRLTLTNATTLYDLVTAEGMGKTTVIVRGDDPPGYYTPSQPPQQKRPLEVFSTRLA